MLYIIITIIFDLIMVIGLYFIGHLYGGNNYLSLRPDDKNDKDFFESAFKWYLLWAAVQQSIVIAIYLLLKNILPVEADILVCGCIFMLLHTPNIVLMFAVFGMELFLLTSFNAAGVIMIPFMCVTHSVLATALLKFFPSDFTKGFQVLWNFFKVYINKK